jgi:alkylated DNA repair protein alkB family protein 8
MTIPQGLSFSADMITPAEESEIIRWLDAREWVRVNPSNPSSRRVQQYGHAYVYATKGVSAGVPMEGPILALAQRIEAAGLMKPVQCIVNEYFQTQGISAHSDSKNFGPIIIGISISADGVMTFKRGEERFELFLPHRSMMMMTGESRYTWTHEISSNKSYTVAGHRIMKPDDYRRISLTFRELA